ncbi:MAG: citrate synthase [Candidatus Methanomethylophilaceae archaeon]|nr:citrate synthase [Candidatus Methanomethylophilaceae archaeon]
MSGKDYFERQADICVANDNIPAELYTKFDVKKGLRDKDGKGVITGITNISRVDGFVNMNGVRTPCEGKLQYRGYEINDLIFGHHDQKFAFEESAYLLLFGSLPTKEQLEEFKDVIASRRKLPDGFVRDIILEAHSSDVMNSISRSILTLATYDKNVMDCSIPNVLRQCVDIISVMPMLAVYAYQAYKHYELGDSLIIHRPKRELSMAENILRLLRPDKGYTELEAKVLDAALVLHMEHGGGNNSTFTARVITSAGSDTYSVVSASLSSLKGPKHGGANIKVVDMVNDIKSHVKDTDDKKELSGYLEKILDKKAFDGLGLIYGMGHAVYSLSDPRAKILKGLAGKLAEEKGREKDLRLYHAIEELTPDLIRARKNAFTGICANVDLYSGFVYDMLGLPKELYTPIFACARVVGWSAHRIEELTSSGKIIRPAYVSMVEEKVDYVPITERK